MEHICGHLKAHAADSINFRTLVAQPRLGRVRDLLFCFALNIVFLTLKNV